MRFPFRRRWILCSANNGVNVVMYRPIVARMEADRRLKFFHTGTLSHTRRIDDGVREDLRAFFDRVGVRRGVLPYRLARLLPFDIYLSPNFSQRVMPRLAKMKVEIFHGVSFKNCAVSDKALAFDRLFLPGPYHRRRFIETGLLKDGDPRMVMVGVPKLDRLSDGTLSRTRVLLDLELDPAVPTVLYAPTGDVGNSLHRHGEEIINALLDLPVNVIVKPHDHAANDPQCTIDWSARLRAWEHPRLRSDLGSDVVPLLAAADLLVTDASSVAFEYTLRDRPIVFFDVPEIVHGKRAAQIDLKTWGRKGGTLVSTAAELRETIPRLLERPEELSEVRRAIAKDLFFQPGSASARAARHLYEALELDAPDDVRAVASATVG